MTTTFPAAEAVSCYCPIEPAIHPEVDTIERAALAWVDTIGLVHDERERARVAATNSAEFFSRFAPFGSADNVRLAAQWVYWGGLDPFRRTGSMS